MSKVKGPASHFAGISFCIAVYKMLVGPDGFLAAVPQVATGTVLDVFFQSSTFIGDEQPLGTGRPGAIRFYPPDRPTDRPGTSGAEGGYKKKSVKSVYSRR